MTLISTNNKLQIRCSNDRPSCKRCVRLKNICHYESSKIRQQDRNSKLVAIPNTSTSRLPGSPSNLDLYNILNKEPAPLEASGDGIYADIPPSLVNSLVDLYFDNVYQSDLLLHKPTFLQSLVSGNVRPHVLLSICAWGAK